MQNSGKIHEYRPANFVFLIPSEKKRFCKADVLSSETFQELCSPPLP